MLKKICKNYARIFLGPVFWGSSLIIAVLMSFDTETFTVMNNAEWSRMGEYYDIMMKLCSSFWAGGYFNLFMILAAGGFCLQFCKEWNAGVAPQIIKKWGMKKYCMFYTVMSFLSGGGSVVVGVGIWCFYMHRFFQIVNYQGENYEGAVYNYEYAVRDHNAVIAMAFVFIMLFLAGALVAILANIISTHTCNKYIVMILPYIIYKAYIEIAKSFQISDRFRIDYYFLGRQDIGSSYVSTVVIMVIIAVFIIIVGYFGFLTGVRRKLSYGKY